jgi:hypothetical protein
MHRAAEKRVRVAYDRDPSDGSGRLFEYRLDAPGWAFKEGISG